MDGVWVLHDDTEEQMALVVGWMQRLDEEWLRIGVETGVVLGEIQGAIVGEQRPFLGVGPTKLLLLLLLMSSLDLVLA